MAKNEADIGKTFSQAFRCAKSSKRMLPFFLANLVYLAAILASFDAFLSLIRGIAAGEGVMSTLVAFIPTILGLIAVLIIMFFVSLYLNAGLIDNARNYWSKKELRFSQSLRNARPQYASLVGAAILVAIIVAIFNVIPLVGWLISLILSWAFIVYAPAVIISKKGAVGGMKESWHIFMDNKLHTFLFWLVLVIAGGVLALLAFVPLIIAALPAIAAVPSMGFIAAVKSNMVQLAVGGIITAFFLSFVTVFQESAKTFYYMQARKEK